MTPERRASPEWRQAQLDRAWRHIDWSGVLADSCYVWTGARDRDGYGRFWLSGGSRQAHRAIYALANDVTLNPAAQVRHTCDNPSCVRISHLRLGTHTDNMRDRSERGRTNGARGSDNGQALLTEEAVVAMRIASVWITADTIARIARVHKRTAQDAIAGRTWRHVK